MGPRMSDVFQAKCICNPLGGTCPAGADTVNKVDSMEFLTEKLKHSKNNDDFFDSMNT